MASDAELEALIAKWRNEAAAKDSFHATMGVGWKACANDLEALLARAPMIADANGGRCPSHPWSGLPCATCGEPRGEFDRCPAKDYPVWADGSQDLVTCTLPVRHGGPHEGRIGSHRWTW
jgi:hypothetical protein